MAGDINNIADLITSTKINRRIYTDPMIFEAEIQKIWNRSWLFLAHVSEVRNPGDFITTHMGMQPVVLCRDGSGDLHVFFNTCRHRGAIVCREESGSAKVFQCLYHAWTYSLSGALVGVPIPDAYGSNFRREDFSLSEVPRVEAYKGLIFASLNKDVKPLDDHLGGAREYIDTVLGYEEGTEVLGAHRYQFNANWKLILENTTDGYHGLLLHKAVGQAGMVNRNESKSIALGNGHALLKLKMQKARGDMGDLYGMDATRTSPETSIAMLIFPNAFLLHINDAIALRMVIPVSNNITRVVARAIGVFGEPADLRSRRVDQFSAGWGPAGIAGADDVEAFEACQEGFKAGAVEWSDMSRGFGRDQVGSSYVGEYEDETSIRGVYQEWKRLLIEQ